MSKTDRIREVLAAATTPLSPEQVCAALGEPAEHAKKIADLLSYMRQRGTAAGSNADGWTAGSGKPPQRKAAKRPKRPKRLKGFKAERRERKKQAARSFADFIKRPGLSHHALENYVGATELLITTIEQEVEGLANNPLLSAALANHKRAQAMFKATRGA